MSTTQKEITLIKSYLQTEANFGNCELTKFSINLITAHSM